VQRTAGPIDVRLVVGEHVQKPISGEAFRNVGKLEHFRHHEQHDKSAVGVDGEIARWFI
jgi:hypothetical protein